MLVCSFNKEKVLVGAFSGNCEIREGSFRALLGNHPRVRLIGVSVICDTLISSLNHTGLCSRHGKITCNYSSNLTAAKEVAPPNCRKRLKIVICTVARRPRHKDAVKNRLETGTQESQDARVLPPTTHCLESRGVTAQEKISRLKAFLETLQVLPIFYSGDVNPAYLCRKFRIHNILSE